MSKNETHRVITTSAEIDAAIARAKTYDIDRPHAVDVIYRDFNDTLLVRLATGIELSIPRKLLQGLEGATLEQLRKVEIDDFGSALHWEELNVDHYVPGLLQGILGTRKWMSAIGRKGGTARSEAKTLAVRDNGAKGGRPKKAGLDQRYRDMDGRIRAKGGSTLIGALRETYGPEFAAGFRADMKLDTLLSREKVSSLSEFQRKHRRKF